MDRSPNFISRLASGWRAFLEAFMVTDLQDKMWDRFSEWDARRFRYALYWAFYENSAYRNIHNWSLRYKTNYGLYRYIRQIFNPSQRLGNFYREHLFGGQLDPMAGDGKTVPTCLPILIPGQQESTQAALRTAIAQVLDWGQFEQLKGRIGLWGAILGDTFLKIDDDLDRQMVYPSLIHPGKIQSLELDSRGNIRGYKFIEQRADPRDMAVEQLVEYGEEASRDGDNVVYRTFLNGTPHDWGQGAEWRVPYGFVPMIHIKHNDVGEDFGWSEIHAGEAKFREIDDLTSKFDDHLRKVIDPAWLMAGVTPPQKDDKRVTRAPTEPTEDRPEPGRDEINALWATNPQAKAHALTGDLNIEATVSHINLLLEELQRDYPEIRQDEKLALQSNSSRAIRVARQPTEVKVHNTRVNYDSGIKRALQMCISIGSMRGYPSFKGFTPDSFKEGQMGFYIGKRPVFAKDPMDDLEYQKEFWTIAATAAPVVGLEYVLRDVGQWDEADVQKALAEWEKNGRPAIMPPTAAGGGPAMVGAAQSQGNQASGGAGN